MRQIITAYDSEISNMHYKRKKPRQKKEISWGSPKEYQIKRHNPNSNPAKKKHPCKKGKGPHDYRLWKREKVLLWEWKTYRCIICGKKKYINL